MAIGDDALEGLDLSVLENITVSPEKDDAKTEETKTEGEPSIFEPQLKIQEVEEIPEEQEESKEETQEVVENVENETPESQTEDKEELVSETSETSEEEEEAENPLRVFAEMQREKGLIDYKDDEFEDNEEWLLNKVSETVDYKVSEYKDTMPAEIRYLLENYEEGVPLTNLLNMQSQEQVYESITPEA